MTKHAKGSFHPLVSIIVPVYNTEQYLAECLDSCLAQTLKAIEVLCVNDGSTDGSGAILQRYAQKDRRVRVVSQTNQGVSAARNTGIQEARGKFVFFLDSDDLLAPNAAEALVRAAEESAAEIAVPGAAGFPEGTWADAALATRDVVCNNPVRALFHESGSYPFAFKLFRRSFLIGRGLSFSTALELGEDHAFVCCAYPHAHTVVYLAEKLYSYRTERDGSALDTLLEDTAAKLAQHLDVVRTVFAYWAAHGFTETYAGELVQWASDFLLADTWQMPRPKRERFAAEYRAALEGYGLLGAANALRSGAKATTAAVLKASGRSGRAVALLRRKVGGA